MGPFDTCAPTLIWYNNEHGLITNVCPFDTCAQTLHGYGLYNHGPYSPGLYSYGHVLAELLRCLCAYIATAYLGMAYIVTADVVMACTVTACIGMALHSRGHVPSIPPCCAVSA